MSYSYGTQNDNYTLPLCNDVELSMLRQYLSTERIGSTGTVKRTWSGVAECMNAEAARRNMKIRYYSMKSVYKAWNIHIMKPHLRAQRGNLRQNAIGQDAVDDEEEAEDEEAEDEEAEDEEAEENEYRQETLTTIHRGLDNGRKEQRIRKKPLRSP